MRLPKTALLAASVFTASTIFAAVTNYTTTIYGSPIFVDAGDTAVLDAAYSGSINELTGDGNFVKNGTGVLQYKGFQSNSFYNFTWTRYVAGGGVAGQGATIPPGQPITLTDLSGLTGSLTVNQGELQVAGYLNMWKEWNVRPDSKTPIPDPIMEGVSGVHLNDTARLSFINTPQNIIPGADSVFKGTTNHDTTLLRRYNAVQNLTAGGIAGGAQTVLDSGVDTNYRIVVHIDNNNTTVKESGVGSIGILAGKGDVIKTGRDELVILGASERGFGRLVIGAGQVRLADAAGLAVATATSVNLVGTDGHRGGSLDTDYQGGADWWRPAFVPGEGRGLGTSSLVLGNSQIIRNLQADFAFDVAPDPLVKTVDSAILQSWKVKARDEAFTPGTGAGTSIDVGANTLTIDQTRDGLYRGSILGTGTVVVNIEANHRFGLILENPMEAGLVIQGAGIFAANANGLGSRTVTVSGNLDIYQDNAGTLNALLNGSGVVRLTASLKMNNSADGLDPAHDMEVNANGNRGTLAVGRRQSSFTGTLAVLDGQTLELSSIADNALDQASSVSLLGDSASGGRLSTLSIADGVQTLRNLQANENSEVRLGRGTLVLKAGSLGGVTSGVGNIVFDGSNSINGAKASYFGATVVKSGTLTVNGSLANSSGLILGAGARFNGASADQSFGALFGAADSVIDMGGRTLTVGATGLRQTLLQQQLAGGNLLSTDLLATTFSSTVAGSPVTVGDMDTAVAGAAPDASLLFDYTASGIAAATRRYLLNVAGLDRATAESLAFAGSITGTGGLVKVGDDRLILTGVNTYTGATSIQGGTLQIDGDSLPSSSGISVSAGAALAVNVDAGISTVFDRTVSGAGNFEKIGAGELTLASGVVAYTGTTTVSEGTLRATLIPAMLSISIADGAKFVAAAGSASPFASAVTGSSGATFVKEGADTLELTNTAGFFGDYEVAADATGVNTLRIHSAPFANVTVGAGGTLAVALTGAATVSGQTLSGAGTLRFEGGSVNIGANTVTGFTGTLAGTNTTITATVDGIAPSAAVSLVNSTLDLGATRQAFAGLSGDAPSRVAMSPGGVLTLTQASGTQAVYAGGFTGAGELFKEGAGTLSLTSTESSTWLGQVTVNAGTLEATPQALGSSSTTVLVNAAGTFAVRNDNVASPIAFVQSVTGAGMLAKTGLGEVRIASVGVTGGVSVREGRLTITAATDASVFKSVDVLAGATYQVNLPAGGLIHDSGSPTGEFITGAGNLAVDGQGSNLALTLASTGGVAQSYTGLTELLNTAQLNFGAGVTSLNGLKGSAGTVVNLPAALALNQTSDGDFAGDFAGGGDLTVTGAGRFIYSGRSGNLGATGVGAVTVDGGKLQVGVANTKTVTLANNGALYVDTGSTGGTYTGAVVGSGSFIKTGAADFDFSAATNLSGFSGTVGVAGGRLIVTPSTLSANGATVTGLTTGGAGTLALDAASGTVENLIVPVTGDGALAKTGLGTLKINSATLLGSTGVFTVEQGTLGGNFRTAGDLVVNSGAHLAPGNSPGTVTVSGNFTNNGTLDMELNAETSDRIVVSGTATIGGVIALAQDNTPGSAAPLRGTVYTLVTAAGGVTLNSPVVTLSPALQAQGILRARLFLSDADTLDTYVVSSLNATPGYTPHDGLGGLVSMLDAGVAPVLIQDAVDTASAGELRKLVNNLSPLGYAAEYAMAQDGDNRRQALLHDRLDARRYDRGSDLTTEDAPWEAFVVGGAVFADNKTATDTPTFDYRTYGGLVGLDCKLNDGLVVGGAIGYDNGTADIHDHGGKVELNRGAGTLFLSGQLTSRWYFDLGLTGGVGLYESKRNTFAGRVKGDNLGFSGGLNAETGTLIVLAEDLHLTPYVGVAYTHHEFDGFTEKGADTRLKVDGWSQDSLRTKIGSGLGWFVPLEWCRLKLGFDLAYAHELLDTESDIDARFASGGNRFSTTAAALPQDSVSATPSLGFEFNNSLSATVSYSYEMGFDGRNYQSVNLAVRKRF